MLSPDPEKYRKSVLFVTLDSCRYDTFEMAHTPHLEAIGRLYRAMAPGYFTYSSHAAMFMGFTPGMANRREPLVNPKYGKIFKMVPGGFEGQGPHHVTLQGRNIIDGFKRVGYVTLGSGGVGWFNPRTETGQSLTGEFDQFYFPGNTYSLPKQVNWLLQATSESAQPVFAFLNIGETHVPYYYEGAPWHLEDNPCVPFSDRNDARECRHRQKASLEYVDRILAPVLEMFRGGTIVICADHGDCWGEDGLWEHGFYHEKVLEVPLIFRLSVVS